MSDDPIVALGFELVQARRDGTRQYSLRANPYLSYWLLGHPDGSAELSWEFGLGEYLAAKGMSVSAQDALSLLLFPAHERRGRLDPEWVAGQVEEVTATLRSIDLSTGA